jgi:hypothetical protein
VNDDRSPHRDEILVDLQKIGSHALHALQLYADAFNAHVTWLAWRDETSRDKAKRALALAQQGIRDIPREAAADAEVIDRALTCWIQATLPALDFAKRRHR